MRVFLEDSSSRRNRRRKNKEKFERNEEELQKKKKDRGRFAHFIDDVFMSVREFKRKKITDSLSMRQRKKERNRRNKIILRVSIYLLNSWMFFFLKAIFTILREFILPLGGNFLFVEKISLQKISFENFRAKFA